MIERAIADDPILPRRNGELLFAAPWESRTFGLVIALSEAGVVEWDDFRTQLIEHAARWEREHPDASGWSYYARWHEALETVLAECGLVELVEIDSRAGTIAYEHAHDHDHA